MNTHKFIHVVNFWLKKELSDDEIKHFEKGVQSLSKVDSLTYFNVGSPADTDRPNIDRTYNYCLLTVFNDKAGHDAYQIHPVHLAFVDSCKHLWDKVLIYDSESI